VYDPITFSLPSNENLTEKYIHIVMIDSLPIEKYFARHLKIKHLRLLVELADKQTVAQVAAALHVSQPAISKMLGEMEEGIGVKLFERAGRGIKPTPSGECLIRHAREVLFNLQKAHQEMRSLATGTVGKVTVGILSVVSTTIIPKAVKILKTNWPNVTICIMDGTVDQQLQDLREGKIDMIIGRVFSERAAEHLQEEVLYDDPLVIVTSSKNPLAHRDNLTWMDLNNLPWILSVEESPTHQRMVNLLAKNGLNKPTDVIESVSRSVNIPLLMEPPRLGLLSLSAARQLVAEGVLQILPLNLGPLPSPVGMIWNKTRPLSHAALTFQECIRQASLAYKNMLIA
jgi:DNA-binding transcriptional LysR family regulator